MSVHGKLIILALAAATALMAQRGAHVRHPRASTPNANFLSPYRAMPAPSNAHRFGNILFPGGTSTAAPVVNGPIQPFGGYRGPVTGPRVGSRRGRTVVVPYAVPVFAGGFGYGYGGYGYAPPQQPVTVVVPQTPPATVIINNHFGDGEVESTTTTPDDGDQISDRRLKVYEAPQASAPASAPVPRAVTAVDESPSIYLIVGRDGVTRQAIGYWVRDGRLHYVTANAEIRQVGVDEVDLEASEQVNAQRKLPFELRRLLN